MQLLQEDAALKTRVLPVFTDLLKCLSSIPSNISID